MKMNFANSPNSAPVDEVASIADRLTKAGYSEDDIAKMSRDELRAAIAKLPPVNETVVPKTPAPGKAPMAPHQ